MLEKETLWAARRQQLTMYGRNVVRLATLVLKTNRTESVTENKTKDHDFFFIEDRKRITYASS
jgi:hypothetical protein